VEKLNERIECWWRVTGKHLDKELHDPVNPATVFAAGATSTVPELGRIPGPCQ
jgi:hypothetical protein